MFHTISIIHGPVSDQWSGTNWVGYFLQSQLAFSSWQQNGSKCPALCLWSTGCNPYSKHSSWGWGLPSAALPLGEGGCAARGSSAMLWRQKHPLGHPPAPGVGVCPVTWAELSRRDPKWINLVWNLSPQQSSCKQGGFVKIPDKLIGNQQGLLSTPVRHRTQQMHLMLGSTGCLGTGAKSLFTANPTCTRAALQTPCKHRDKGMARVWVLRVSPKRLKEASCSREQIRGFPEGLHGTRSSLHCSFRQGFAPHKVQFLPVQTLVLILTELSLTHAGKFHSSAHANQTGLINEMPRELGEVLAL